METVFKSSDSKETMRIDSSGNVGIGTDSPDTQLHVFGSGSGSGTYGAQITIGKNNGCKISSTQESTDDDKQGLAFFTKSSSQVADSAVERLRIDSSGNVLVGTTDQYAFNGGFTVQTDTVDYINVGHASSVASGNYYAAFRHGTNTLGTITQNGTTGILYNTSSDERLKENITDSADADSKVDAIQIRQFDWIADGSHQDYGVIAQELVTVAPEAVSEGDTEEDMMGVDYSKLVPMLIKEVQSLRSRVAELENV